MPETATFGFEYETPQSKPGITLTGDIDGSSPILAEQVDSALSGIDSRLTAAEGAITTLQGSSPSDTGWIPLSLTLGTGFALSESNYRQWGPIVTVRIILVRTGADITANSAGNVGGDPLIATISNVDARPDRQRNVLARCMITSGSVTIGTSGVIQLTDLHSNSSLRTDDDIRVSDTYFVSTFI